MEHVPKYSIFLIFGTSRVENLLAAFARGASYYSCKNMASTSCAINKYPFHQESSFYHKGREERENMLLHLLWNESTKLFSPSCCCAQLFSPSLELAPANSPLFPKLSLTSHRSCSANTCGVFVLLFKSLCSTEMLLFFSLIFWLFLISIVFVCGRLCFQAKKDPLAHLIWSPHITYQSIWPSYPYADPYFTWLIHTFWTWRLFCFENMRRRRIHQSFELLIPIVNGQSIHPFISVKKHFYQFSPCNDFPLCGEPRVPLFEEHLLTLIWTFAIIAL